jgi:hypothetical protein
VVGLAGSAPNPEPKLTADTKDCNGESAVCTGRLGAAVICATASGPLMTERSAADGAGVSEDGRGGATAPPPKARVTIAGATVEMTVGVVRAAAEATVTVDDSLCVVGVLAAPSRLLLAAFVDADDAELEPVVAPPNAAITDDRAVALDSGETAPGARVPPAPAGGATADVGFGAAALVPAAPEAVDAVAVLDATPPDGEPGEESAPGGAASAVPCPVVSATPTPRATAIPPTCATVL